MDELTPHGELRSVEGPRAGGGRRPRPIHRVTVIECESTYPDFTSPTAMPRTYGITVIGSPLVKWCQSVLEGGFATAIQPKTVQVSLLNPAGGPERVWNISNAFPVSWTVEAFNSTKNEVAVEKIELMVRATNLRAIHLYQSLGFTDEGRIRRRVKTADGTYHDDIAMGLFVDRPD